ncbi:KAT8 regulatory NSL complex subunit 3-like [Teleopsis dalmanni]|uniref:KAT8 regulatory NSL complex subunit 3-like n=1 Tax=Teleopsis dalmanni TaxID=139649 RepID=UPI0018CE076D|nr:KAT8 regulatory NSL complex subunit 3-like [Teleopsis dalmanni]
MSENIACVICMGFAFHTLNGVRGMPDDRILDIKVPILFVIGQNSAKTSTEEMEHLREKLQSESAVVVVGSADDSLRVPKIRRKIENVTQATVDSMIVKEMYDFVNKTLNNRPGPRQPTPIGIATTLKGKVSNGENSGTKVNTGQRKRKAEPIDDDEKLAQLKTKYGVKSLKRSRKTRLAKSRIDKSTTDPMLPKRRGRPRTKALNPGQKVNKSVSASKLQAQQTQQASSQASPNSTINDDLSAAMQTILSETNDGDFVTNTNNTTGPKAMTSFDIVAQPKSGTGGNPQKPHIISSTVLPNINTARLRVLPSNQFIQLRSPMQSQSKVYTIKPTGLISQSQLSVTAAQNPSIGSIIKTTSNPAATGQQQIFTLKSPNGKTTQFVTAASPAAHQKYTVVKTPNGGTTLQLTTNAPKTVTETSTGNLDLSNIIDMPIVFADNDGNLTESVVQSTDVEAKTQLATIKQNPTSNVGQLIINPQLRKDGTTAVTTLALSKPGTIMSNTQSGNKGKVVFINRNNMKPCSSIISRNNLQGLTKYAKVVVNKTEGATTSTSSTVQTTRCNTQITQIGGTNHTITPISSAVKQVNIQPIKTLGSGSRIVNIGSKITPQYKIISTANSGTVLATGNGENVRNIVIKSAIKPMPANMNTQLINRNLVVRKFVKPLTGGINPKITSSINVINSTSTSSNSNIAPLLQDGGSEMNSNVGTTAIQTSPKIITLNPVNPSAKLD